MDTATKGPGQIVFTTEFVTMTLPRSVKMPPPSPLVAVLPEISLSMIWIMAPLLPTPPPLLPTAFPVMRTSIRVISAADPMLATPPACEGESPPVMVTPLIVTTLPLFFSTESLVFVGLRVMVTSSRPAPVNCVVVVTGGNGYVLTVESDRKRVHDCAEVGTAGTAERVRDIDRVVVAACVIGECRRSQIPDRY